MKVCYAVAVAAAVLLAKSARADLVSAVQVVVNNDVITYGQIFDLVSPRLPALVQIYPTNQIEFEKAAERLKNEQVQSLVERDLILHAFTAKVIKPICSRLSSTTAFATTSRSSITGTARV